MSDTSTRHDPIDLDAMGRDLLDRARAASAGRAATTLTPGAGADLTQTVLALAEGRRLDDHRAPGPATLQVIEGAVAITTADGEIGLSGRQWCPIPDESHGVRADTDAVLLLTVGPRRSDQPREAGDREE